MRHFTTTALCLALAAPAGAQTLFDALVAQIVKPKTAAAKDPAPAGFVAAISAQQSAAIDKLLEAPLNDPQVAAARAEAAPLIRTLLATAACAKASEAWNVLNRDSLTPRTYKSPFSGELVPMSNLEYHDKNSCLDVARLTEWAKPANNALRFRAYYIASDSGEAKQQLFEVQKMDGRWMVRTIGSALV